MDQTDLREHLRNTRFAPGDRETASSDARRITRMLEAVYGAEVYGVGPLFESPRTFRTSSDIDLGVKGIPANRFIRASVQV